MISQHTRKFEPLLAKNYFNDLMRISSTKIIHIWQVKRFRRRFNLQMIHDVRDQAVK